ncbi:MAG: M13 family metallopeptidase [Bacteroidota bacterium]|nr:M13 family metallopeptidase [Bacteroidota bacterium]
MKLALKKAITLYLPICILIISSCNQSAGSKGQSDLLDTSGIDSTVRPQDDFFHYVNGGWIKKTEIPASEGRWGSFTILQQKTQLELKFILDSCANLKAAKGSNAQKVGDFYSSAMDSSTIEQKGFQPLQADMQRINTLQSSRDVLKEVAFEYNMGLSPLISFSAGPDAKNSDVVTEYFNQGGLGLPNKDYYTKMDSSTQNIRKAYTKYIAKVLTLSGDDSTLAAAEAASVMKIEYALANASKKPVELRDPYANYHKMAVAELSKKEPNMNWSWLPGALGVKADSVVVGQPAYYAALNNMLLSVSVSDWKNYLRFRYINFFAPYLSTPFVNANFDLEKMLTGQKELQPRWKRMAKLTDEKLGDALGELYVKKFFPPEAKQRILDLVNNIQQTYKERIDSFKWMSDLTKQKAIGKLNAFAKKIGYPDKWKDYSSVDISRNDFIQNLKNTGHFAYQYMINKIGKPVDRSEWFMTPPTINAYYNTSTNDINFPAGILQPPFFYKNGDDAINYGAIGAAMGHEMTHGFDDQGRKFDARGNLKNWWLPSDSANFKKRTDLVVNQYNHSLVVDTLHINGELTQGENIADIGGVTIAYAAFKKTAEGKSDKKIDGLTPDQRFFMSWAEIWRAKTRPEIARMLIMTNPHSPAMYRVNNPLSDIPAFYKAFHVKPGDKMYLPDSLRAQVW